MKTTTRQRETVRYANHCVYAIRHPDYIRACIGRSGPHRFSTKKRRWATAGALIRQARQLGQIVPIVFASATDTRSIFAAAELLEIKMGKANEYVVENVRLLAQEIPKTRLRKLSDGRYLDATYQRDYVICHTPKLRFVKRSRVLQKLGVSRGSQDAIDDQDISLPVRQSFTGFRYARNPKVRAQVVGRAEGRCELCGDFGFILRDGSRYLETHHIIALAKDGADRLSNVIALCPKHHREAHYGKGRQALERRMIATIRRKLGTK